MPEAKSDQHLIEQLESNYHCLQRQYRLGRFEGTVAYAGRWRPAGDESGSLFYELCVGREMSEQVQTPAGEISFADAINDLYALVTYVKKKMQCTGACELLLLRCKCLIYEATDYFLRVPPELGVYFINYAEDFPQQVAEADSLAGDGGSAGGKDKLGRVIKVQIIAALCGANELYRRHGPSSYKRALELLEKLNRYILEELPRQHEQERESFGLIGLAQYLTGRVLSAKGAVKESHKAYRQSAEAYVARLRQKEQFFELQLIKPHEYEEKISVTLRRAALVTAFGDGYLSFISSRLARALESLTLARAALSRNSGRVYRTYVDMLYWACKRAAHSTDAKRIEEIVRELRNCRKTLGELTPDSHYFHRAGLQLALALYYRRMGSPDQAEADYEEGMLYLNEAITHAEQLRDDEFRNPHLLAAALVTKSRFLSARYQSPKAKDPAAARRYTEALAEAEAVAQRACEVSVDIKGMESESWATLGDVYSELAVLHKGRRERFYFYFDEALKALRLALKKNRGDENIRIDAVCYVRLTKLCLLDPNTKLLAHQYFEEWKKIEPEVEHDYWKRMAVGLEGKLGGPALLVKAWETLNYGTWEKRLAEFLLEESLKNFVAAHAGHIYKDEKLESLLRDHLRLTIGYGDRKVAQLIKDRELLEKVKTMRAHPAVVRPRQKRKSFIAPEPESETEAGSEPTLDKPE